MTVQLFVIIGEDLYMFNTPVTVTAGETSGTDSDLVWNDIFIEFTTHIFQAWIVLTCQNLHHCDSCQSLACITICTLEATLHKT